MGIPDHLTCLLRNLYAGQEATVRTGHGMTDWFQIRKGVCQDCILSPCLFNLYAEWKWSEVAQLCLTPSDPMDCSPPGSSAHGILQARILEWVAMPSSRGSSHPEIEPKSPTLQVSYFTIWATREAIMRNTGLDEAQVESRLPGEISITSDMAMTPPLWQKSKKY